MVGQTRCNGQIKNLVACGVLTLALASCASSGELERNKAVSYEIERTCNEEWARSYYDPLRGKLVFQPTNEITKLQFNTNLPTASEKPLIAAFAAFFHDCHQRIYQNIGLLFPDVGSRLSEYSNAQVAELVNLYNGSITYGEFNKRRLDVLRLQASNERVIREQALQAERQASSRFWEDFVRGREKTMEDAKRNRPLITRCAPGLQREIVCMTSSTGY